MMVNNVNFKDYLNQQLQNFQFKQEFENEATKLEREITITHHRKKQAPLNAQITLSDTCFFLFIL
ncbi:hypothetical protein [Limosilactobacillus agrestimuris]|uniref:hypothetical protein n=1 Tax=Limosilactobacillus agrestimuris TaxID=2941331 RepID=UPI00203EEA97|nr:hypothetical protein [Limosilactobacillus agrestimuris]